MTFKTAVIAGVAGSETVVVTDLTTGSAIIDMISMPFGVTAADEELVSKSLAAYASVGWGVTGFLVGEALGHSRARKGSTSFIPLFRG